ncbi:MAG: GNAT family N-acetyltransferase [Anaerolineae bacterium]|nr:GNAT family N-acetyltransferase [Gloeobacterales cyanobacterium ES-bin-313]
MCANRFTVQEVPWQTQSAALYAVRRQVFIVEQGVPAQIEIDEWDPLSRHVLAIDVNGGPVGCGRLLPDGHIGRMAVLAEGRGKGVGQQILQTLITMAESGGITHILLSAQTHALGFYEKAGFVAEGPIYEEAGIPHRAMSLNLPRRTVLDGQSPL